MKITILGGGIAAISLAYFLQNKKKIQKINILEKSNKFGGLLRSYKFEKIYYDVGPHIIFSKHKEILDLNKKILSNNLSKLRRSNKIIYNKKKFIKYPFENELSKLNKKDLKYCLDNFLNNPYKDYIPENMYQFFLKTFGKGISELYLNIYNEKIWKFDPNFLDTQMVERIPKPPISDIIKSAKGIKTEGYKHQLNFYYPKKKGIQSLFDSFKNSLNNKVNLINNAKINKIITSKNKHKIYFNNRNIKSDYLISTIPLNELNKYVSSNPKISEVSKKLLFNSIKIIMLKVKGNFAGKNFAFMIPDKDIIFHRISKLNFLGKNYSKAGFTYFQAEITYKKNDLIDKMSLSEIKRKVKMDLKKINFINSLNDVKKIEVKSFKYAYVIYDLDHRKNVDYLINFYKNNNIICSGRFGSWEYLNSDQVIYQSFKISKKIN